HGSNGRKTRKRRPQHGTRNANSAHYQHGRSNNDDPSDEPRDRRYEMPRQVIDNPGFQDQLTQHPIQEPRAGSDQQYLHDEQAWACPSVQPYREIGIDVHDIEPMRSARRQAWHGHEKNQITVYRRPSPLDAHRQISLAAGPNL